MEDIKFTCGESIQQTSVKLQRETQCEKKFPMVLARLKNNNLDFIDNLNLSNLNVKWTKVEFTF